jgi:hypothetical protein
MHRKRLPCCLRAVAGAPLLLGVSGCLAGFERGIDLILSPGAIDAILVAPFSAVGRIAEFASRFVV